MNFKNIIKFLSSIAMLSMSSMASATSSLLKPADGDKAVEMIIKPLFGELSGLGGSDPLMNVIGIFNSIALLIGGILVLYTLVAGTMSSAHDGEVLGKRWSSLWLPIRTALGAAAIFPINGGYCFLQKVIMWLALMGIGAADSLWSMYVENFGAESMNKISFSSPSHETKIKLMLKDMLIFNVCERSITGQIQETQYAESVDLIVADRDNVRNNEKSSEIKYWKGTCGIVAYSGADNMNTSVTSLDGEVSGTFSSVYNVNAFDNVLRPIHESKMIAADAKLKVLADKIVNNPEDSDALSEEIKSTFDSIAKDWNTAIATQAKAEVESLKPKSAEFAKSLSKEGFLFAGAWYMEMAKSQDAISRAVGNYPSSSPGAIYHRHDGNIVDESLSWVAKKIGAPSAEARDLMTKTDSLASPAVSGGISSLQNFTDESIRGGDLTTKIIETFMSSGDAPISGNASIDGNPIFAARSLGTNMVTWSVSAWIAGVAVSAPFPAVSGILLMLCGPLLVSGALMAYYMPMLPMILWVGAIFGWVILLVEAVIAAPIWGVSWLAPDADGVVGKGGQGYMLILSLTLRPPLMILGLISAIVLMDVIGAIVNSMFIAAFASGKTPSSLTAIIGMIAGCVIYATLMLSMMNRVFSLIHVIADKILRWISISGGELGQEAHALESGTTGKVVAGVGAAQGLSTAAGNMAQQRGLNKQRELGDEKRKKDSEERSRLSALGSANDDYSSASAREDETRRNLDEALGHESKSASLRDKVSSASNMVDTAEDNYRSATSAYSEAVKNFGSNSNEAFEALQSLNSNDDARRAAKNDLTLAQQDLSRHESMKPTNADIANLRTEHRNASFEKKNAELRLNRIVEKDKDKD